LEKGLELGFLDAARRRERGGEEREGEGKRRLGAGVGLGIQYY
jgi:hypothetical protein